MSQKLQIGEQIGEYRIVGFLGAGGMGSVYHGIHVKIDRPAAIKVLSDIARHSSFTERFFNEARLQSSLHHPNIATLYDFQEKGDVLFIVMEYVDGETLDQLIERRFFAVEDALLTFESICRAVGFIHGNKIVHRDIKPQNIKLASNGTIKLLDFGIAKGALSQGLTRIGGVIGTPNYLAPEQLGGAQATERTDIWALGVLFYEMLTGSEPFRGNSLGELSVSIATSKFEAPEILNTAVPPAVSKIVSRCLVTDPERRYQNVDAILADIEIAKRRYQHEGSEKGRGLISRYGESDDLPPGSTGLASRKGLIFGAAGAFALLFVIVIGVIALFVWNSTGSGGGGNAVAANNKGVKALPTVAASPQRQAAANPTQQPGGASTEKELVAVTVETTEGPADLYRNGELLGRTPVALTGREGELVTVVLKRAGYSDTEEKVEISLRKKVYTFSLKKGI